MLIRFAPFQVFLLSSVVLWQLGTTKAEDVVTVHVTADSENAGYEAICAMDDNPLSMWHTQFSAPPGPAATSPIPFHCGYGAGCSREHFNALPTHDREDAKVSPPAPERRPSTGNNVPPPHAITVDLTQPFKIRGIVQQARSGASNGAIGDYAIYVTGDTPGEDGGDHWGEPICRGTFQKVDTPQRVEFAKPVEGRYLKLVALTELNGQPFTSIAELQILVDGVKFVAQGAHVGPHPRFVSQEQGAEWGGTKELVDQYNLITQEFARPEYYEAIRDQTYRIEATILPADRDAADVVLRRIKALFDDLKRQRGVGFDVEAVGNRIAELQSRTEEVDTEDLASRFALYLDICKLRRRIAFGNPLLNFDEILLIKKHRSTFGHMCDQFYGAYSPAGGGLFVLSQPFDADNPPALRNLLEGQEVVSGRLAGTELTGGAFLSPDLSYDAGRIAFAYVECQGSTEHKLHLDLSQGHWDRGRCYHIFTCRADGSDLRQITDGTWNDFDPCFLPNGRIAFITERRGGYLRCGRACPNYTLFDMDVDGGRIRCLNYHETNEWNPSVTNDGKIIYTRWDYVDRFGCIAHHPWVTSIDGRTVNSIAAPSPVRPSTSPRLARTTDSPSVR